MNVIGIDIGTSGAKGVRVSFPDGKVLQSVRKEYPLRAEGNRSAASGSMEWSRSRRATGGSWKKSPTRST